MRHVDRNSSLSSLDVSDDVKEILRATIHNNQIFDLEGADDPENYTASSIAYDKEDRPRPQFRELNDFPDELLFADAERILDILDHGNSLSRFQLESWRTLTDYRNTVIDENRSEDRAAVISAPTGFGKTASFLGPTLLNAAYQDGSRTIVVYPSRALLKDQLGRILKSVHRINNDLDDADNISVGAWMGSQPYSREGVVESGKSFVNTDTDPPELLAASHWKDQESTFYVSRRKLPKKNPGYEIYDEEYRQTGQGVRFLDKELVLNRNDIKGGDHDRPDILLTTLESLEILAAKPHYDIVTEAEYFIFDEIHQYQGLRGSHAAQIIRNLRRIRDKNAVYVGASATVDNPEGFAAKLFGFTENVIDTNPEFSAGPSAVSGLEPYNDDISEDNDDALHYYFLLSDSEADPGVASQYLQHAMMLGRSLIEPAPGSGDTNGSRDLKRLDPDEGERRKLLSFIQSKSQIHRLTQQFENADKNRQLWRYHAQKESGNWRTLANRTDHKFLDTPNALDNPLPVYSGSDATVSDIDNADIIHGTNFLEVGIDISNLHFISQYRPPGNVTSFKQRAGRAARESGSSGHVFVHLSDRGDSNFHYRADRFVEGEITTPIRPENDIISWIHDRFYEYYQTLSDFQNSDYYESEGYRYEEGDNWNHPSNEHYLIKDYFATVLGWNRFVDLLLTPETALDELFGIQVYAETLLTNGADLDQIDDELKEERADIEARLSDIENYIQEDIGEILLNQDPLEGLLDRMSEQALSLLDELPADVVDESGELRSTIKEVQLDPPSEEKVEDSISVFAQVTGAIEMKRGEIGENQYPGGKISQLRDSIETLSTVTEGDTLDALAQKRKEIYYFRRALENIDSYCTIWYAHGQLTAIKDLFRAAYYFDRCLKVREESTLFQLNSDYAEADGDLHEKNFNPEHTQIWYVPPNYFDDAGKYYTLERPPDAPGEDPDHTEKAVTSALSQYTPYKTEHQANIGESHVFQPLLDESNGRPQFNFSSIPGETIEHVRMPNRIKLDRVRDLSMEQAQGVYPFDEDSLQILTEEELPSDRYTPCKIYSDPHIQTAVEPDDGDPIYDGDGLRLEDTSARAWVEGIELDIIPQTRYEIEGNEVYGRHPDREKYSRVIESSDPKLGYRLDTRALRWDLGSFFDAVESEDALTDAVRMVKDAEINSETYKEFSDVSRTEAAHITAAHLLKLLVSDVAGVDPGLLLYGYDSKNQEIQIFEQTEGGQGIVDIFVNHIEDKPELVLDSFYRLAHNPQILNERLWADKLVVERIYEEFDFDDPPMQDTESNQMQIIQHIVSESLGIAYPTSINRIAEEVWSTVKQISTNSTDSTPVSEFMKFKQSIASARVQGKCTDSDGDIRIPEDIQEEFPELFEKFGEQSLKSMFVSPDIDSCEANLQLNRTLSSAPQEEALSYCILEQLEQYIVDPVPREDHWEEVKDRGQYWAWLDESGDEVLFLQW